MLVTVLAVGALLAGAAPASAAVDSPRAADLCITIHTGGIFDPIRICIPLP
jgi:hypothetical protein